jgi:hypothetical protein
MVCSKVPPVCCHKNFQEFKKPYNPAASDNLPTDPVLHERKKQPGGFLTADNSQNSHHQKNFKHNHLDETVKKMVDNPAANDGRYSGIDEYAQFSRYIHCKHILSGHDGVSAFLP